jgi:multisubunit Na+/H+ antiporter MnhB subunit
MIITKMAFTALVVFVVAAIALIVVEEEVRPRNWRGLSVLDKVLTLCMVGGIVSLIIGLTAFIWGM